MTSPTLLRLDQLDEALATYDGFILDLWGVLIDGYETFPGARAWLERRAAEGKPVWFLSNASRDAEGMAEELVKLGVPRELFAGVTTSGQLAIDAFLHDPEFREGGIYLSGPGTGQVGWPAEIRARFVENIDQAAIILGVGSFPEDELEARFAPLAGALDKHFLCANPDRNVVSGGLPFYAAGKLADRFADLGGVVTWYGKPDPYAYRCAARELGERGASRLLFVGDSLVTDVPGAVAAEIDCLWLAATGIHREALGLDFNQEPTREGLEALLDQHGDRPRFAAAGLA
ncbi:TIGR01459 family HAD-type hydrolase [Pseudomonas oryzihabitans]|uniref:TIGR01459 family HAD-type hydrolase n=1 Tax=Pseudomonas oryzihabitans TaxID=47885 RepID=UPI002894D89C|nr:TIGR01459 family HAD-type hydrolase [Pseudomonas oryzihabitans]MDT3721301.1 TIGR01459 family HAD-type hydrolase [Pseudomonas oryzihabitans]